MTNSIFYTQPNFIERDPRKDRRERYNVNPEFMTNRHAALLPPDILEGASILDIGSCVGATGGWALAHGARYYVGVEINEDLCTWARLNLQEYYPLGTKGAGNWDIINSSFEDYFKDNPDDTFDIVFISGTLYAGLDWLGLIEKLSKASKHVVIESFHPNIGMYADDDKGSFVSFLKDHPDILAKLETVAPFVYMKEIFMYSDNSQNNLLNYGAAPSMGALKLAMERLGYTADTSCYDQLKATIPDWYHSMARFGIHFKYQGNIDTNFLTVKELYDNPEKRMERLQSW